MSESLASLPLPRPSRPRSGGIRRPRRQSRACLMCLETFKSSGPEERVCQPCKDTDEWANAMAVTKGFIEW
jgi:hypothetical protein